LAGRLPESELLATVKPRSFEAILNYVSAARRADLVADSCPGGALLRTMMAYAQLRKEGVSFVGSSRLGTFGRLPSTRERCFPARYTDSPPFYETVRIVEAVSGGKGK
jgi:hypothetical protein